MKLWRVSPARSLADACRSTAAGRWSWSSREVLYTSSTASSGVQDAPRVRGLPGDWRVQQTLTRCIGNAWFDHQDSAALLVPSALCEEADNVLVNPRHPQARGLRMRVVRAFRFDRRLLRKA